MERFTLGMWTTKVFKGFWSVFDCRRHPRWLFIFGDNLIHTAKGGQSVIRDEPNAFGIPTKKRPGYNKAVFFTDDEYEANVRNINAAIRAIIDTMNRGEFDVLVFPENGLGTGLAQLPSRAPRTNAYLVKQIEEIMNQ